MQDVTLGALCDAGEALLQTGPFGSQLHSYDYTPSGTPVIATEGIGRRHIVDTGLPRVPSEVVARLSRHVLKAGDIVFARRGAQATGLSALVTASHHGALCGTGAILLRLTGTKVDPAYLSFYLSLPETMTWLKSHAVGAVMPNLNEGVLRALPVRLPPLEEQIRIASVLTAIDEKIELNQRINATLEEMASSLFKSWFVDFDPSRTTGPALRPSPLHAPGSFPSEFDGDLPKGWTTRPIGDVVRAVGGGTPSTQDARFWDGPHHWARPRDLSGNSSSVLLHTERTITDAGLSQIGSGLLPAGTVLLSSRAPIGFLAIAQVPLAINQGFIGMICDGPLSSYYVLQWCRANMASIEARASGTTFPEISKANFRPIPILVPSSAALRAYDLVAAPLYQRVVASLRESETLADLREALLPRLLSGELRVSDSERTVKALL